MPENESPADHHAAAARHHREAASRHVEASRHYQIGKDYAHAAHQATAARGHGLWAQSHSDNAERDGAPHAPHNGADEDAAGPLAAASTSAEHHAHAARHHQQAARHHIAAVDSIGRGEHHFAAAQSHAARDHARRSIFHGDEAAMLHVELTGTTEPGGELA